jgi:hypothetical protein
MDFEERWREEKKIGYYLSRLVHIFTLHSDAAKQTKQKQEKYLMTAK